MNHHPSCCANDKNLVWLCDQCGSQEYAEYLLDRLEKLERVAEAARDIGSCCRRCEGEGRLWADGKPHYATYQGPTSACGECGGGGKLIDIGLLEEALAALGSTEAKS